MLMGSKTLEIKMNFDPCLKGFFNDKFDDISHFDSRIEKLWQNLIE